MEENGDVESVIVRQRLTRLISVAVAAILGALVAPTSAAAGTLDQSQTNFDASLAFGEQRQAAQTFTAGMSGNLDQVDLHLRRFTSLPVEPPCNSGSGITVEVRTVSAGVPSNTVLAIVNLPASSVPTTSGFVSVPLPLTAVTAGTQYAIVASAPDASCGTFFPYDWGAANGNPYSGGLLLAKLDAGSSWMVQGTVDAAFKTYVATPAPAEQPPVAADSDPPETKITKGAPNKTEKTKIKFKFRSDEPGATFECKIDKKPFKPCTSPKKYRVEDGKHKFLVRAIDAAGNADASAAKDKFKVTD